MTRNSSIASNALLTFTATKTQLYENLPGTSQIPSLSHTPLIQPTSQRQCHSTSVSPIQYASTHTCRAIHPQPSQEQNKKNKRTNPLFRTRESILISRSTHTMFCQTPHAQSATHTPTHSQVNDDTTHSQASQFKK